MKQLKQTFLLGLLWMIGIGVKAEVYYGSCGANGDNVQWLLNTGTGVMEIYGSGDVVNWECNFSPWHEYRSKIQTINISNSVTNIGSYAFFDCTNLTAITIPNSVTSIGRNAFEGCSSLSTIDIPNSVTSIENGAFVYCGLTSITIPESVTHIGNQVFLGCGNLTSITIPNSVTSIGYGAFYYCEGLTSIKVCWSSPLSIPTSVFYEVEKSKCTLYVPQGTKQLYEKADVWKDFGNIVEQFTEGQDVTQLLGVKAADSGPEDGEVKTATNEGRIWQGFDYTQSEKKNDNDYPKYEYLSYDFHTWGIYGVDVWDVYQELENVPSGIYTMSLEALYRGGQLGTVIAKYDIARIPVKNTKIYVQIGDKVYEEYVKDICEGRHPGVIAEDGTKTGLYVASDGAWGSDEKQGNWYYPVSHAGFSAYLDAECDGVSYDNPGKVSMYHNEIQFVVPEDGTKVRIGIKHETPIAEDSSAWDHWRIFYDYAYDEEGLLKVAKEKYEKVWNSMDAFYQETLINYPALGELMGDDLMEIEQNVDETDADAVYAAIDALNAVEAKYSKALITIKSMDYLIGVSKSLIECENRYAECDKEALKTAIENAETAINATLGEAGIESIEDYITAAKALYQARVDYIWSGEIHTGADGTAWRDVSGIVACSGLVNEKYTPFYNEAGEYVYPQEIEDSWYQYHPNDGANTEIETGYINNRITVENYPDLEGKMMPALANEAKWSYDVTDVNRWVYDGTSFKGAVTPAATTYMWYKGYSAHYGGWTANPNDGELKFFQTITDLPEGYYSVEGRMISNMGHGSASDIKQYLFIQGVNEDGSVDEESKYNKQNETNWNSYTRQDWEIGETDMIRLSAGQNLVIGYSQNCEAADGGVILKFYGTDVNFSQLTEEAKQKVITLLEQNEGNFKLLGDKPAVQALLDQVKPESVSDDPGFKAAKAILAEATDFINAAAAYNFNTEFDYAELQNQYQSDNEKSILDKAAAYVDALAESETATYKDGQAADAMYKAYASYMKVFDKAEKLGTDEINGILAQQAANLTTYCDDASVLAQYELDLKNPIYKAIFANLGTENATEKNPVNITEILANPSFTEGVDGWGGTKPTQNEYARGNAEIRNRTTVDMYQKFQGLPAGKYKVTAQACYRDGSGSSDLAKCYQNWQTANGDKEAWNAVNNYNAVLYAKSGRFEGKDLINSVCDTKQTGLSFDTFYVIEEKGYPNDGKFLLYDQLTDEDKPYAEDYATKYVLENEDGTKGDVFQYPFDGRIDLEDGTSLFFPESMAGAALRFAQGEYKVEASVDVHPGKDLQLGIRKDAGPVGDWLNFSNFQLFYLGPIDEPNPSANLLDDESYNFNKGTVGQWHYLDNNDSGTVTNATPGYDGSAGAMALTATPGNTNAYDAQLFCDLKEGAKIERGNTYIVSFWAKGTVEGDIIAPGAGVWPNPEWNNAEPAVLTTDWKQYTYTYEATESNTAENGNTNIYFNQGKLTGTAYVDRILVYDVREEINPDGNLIFDDESYNFEDGTVGQWHYDPWNNSGTFTNSTPGYSSKGCMILTANAGNYSWEAHLLCPLKAPVMRDSKYLITFYAKSDAENEGDIIAPGIGDIWPNPEWNGEPAVLTKEWQKFTYTLVADETNTAADGNGNFFINHGMLTGNAYIDRISVVELMKPDQPQDDVQILSTDSITCTPDKQITVPIYLNNEEGICNFQFQMHLPEGISVAQQGTRVKSYAISLGEKRFEGLDHTVSASVQDDGSMLVLVYSNTNMNIWNEDEDYNDIRSSEPILYVTLDVADNISEGDYAMSFTDGIMTAFRNETTSKISIDDNSTNIRVIYTYRISAACSSYKGSVSISGVDYDSESGTAKAYEYITLTTLPASGYTFWKWTENGEDVSTDNPYTFRLESDRSLKAEFVLLGDVYEDGLVDVADLTSVAGIILTASEPDYRTMLAADVYEDQSIDVADLTSIAGVILGGSHNAKGLGGNMNVRPEVVNMQFDVVVPENISISERMLAEALRSMPQAYSHDVSVKEQNDGSLRVLLTSFINSPIENALNGIKTILVVNDGTMADGTYDITLKNVVMAYSDMTAEKIDTMNAKMIVDDATYINGYYESSNDNNRFFDLNGRRIDTIINGYIYIKHGKTNININN